MSQDVISWKLLLVSMLYIVAGLVITFVVWFLMFQSKTVSAGTVAGVGIGVMSTVCIFSSVSAYKRGKRDR